MGSLEVSGQHETEVRGEFEYNDEVEYDNFEKALEDLDGEEYFDCALKDYDISTVSAMNLARLLLLNNEEIKREVLGIFTSEIYKSLRES